LLPAKLPHQAGRVPRLDDAAMVPGNANGQLRDRLRAALRREPLQDARLLDDRFGRRLRRLVEAGLLRLAAPLRRDRPRVALGLGFGDVTWAIAKQLRLTVPRLVGRRRRPHEQLRSNCDRQCPGSLGAGGDHMSNCEAIAIDSAQALWAPEATT